MVKIMVGTANVFNDYTENANTKSRNIDLLSAWLFGRVNTGCLLVDISTCGGAVLIPKKHPVPSASFDLIIMSPENKDEILAILQAETRWLDDAFSATHKKFGFRLKQTDLLEQSDIETITGNFGAQKMANLECNLLNHQS
jgi:hypothetical protein